MSRVPSAFLSVSRQGLTAVGEERVQLERPQLRSGEDERAGCGTSRRQAGAAAERAGLGSRGRWWARVSLWCLGGAHLSIATSRAGSGRVGELRSGSASQGRAVT